MNRKVLGLAVIAALAAGTAANASNQVLVPFFKQGGGVHTLLTVANTYNSALGDAENGFDQRNVHTIYMHKTSEGKRMAACAHSDGFARMSSNDLMQFTPLNPVNGGYDLIGMNGDQSKPYYLQELANNTDVRAGFAIFSTTDAQHNLSVFANVYDTQNGLSYAFRGIDNALASTATTAAINQGDFVTTPLSATTVAKKPFGSDIYNISWQNLSVLEANWYVLVMGPNMAGFTGVNADAITVKQAPIVTATPAAVVGYNANLTAGLINPSGGAEHYTDAVRLSVLDGLVYDNDENVVSRSVAIDILCNGVVDLQQEVKRFSPKGGWAQLQFTPRIAVSLTTDAQGDLVAANTTPISATTIPTVYNDPTVAVWKVESVVDVPQLGYKGQRTMTIAPESYTLDPALRRTYQ